MEKKRLDIKTCTTFSLSFKIFYFCPQSQSTGSTLQQILDIPHDQRGNRMKIQVMVVLLYHEITSLFQLLKYLKQLRTIQDFPLETQTQLSKVLRFERLTEQCYYKHEYYIFSYESGRVIIKESHYPLAVYFIWYGSGQLYYYSNLQDTLFQLIVYVNSKEKDVRNNGEFNVTVNILKTGDCFGVSTLYISHWSFIIGKRCIIWYTPQYNCHYKRLCRTASSR